MNSNQSSKHFPVKKVRAALELIRPANLITAFADILAGFAAAGGMILLVGGEISAVPPGLPWLLVSTFGLYGGGVVFNDVFDAQLDAKERPERAIPSGRISKKTAALLGGLLLVMGIAGALQVNRTAGILAGAIAGCALLYDAKAKHSGLWGPVCMGLCRGGNLMLGVAVAPSLLATMWPLALLPVAYIGAITLISQGEVQGGTARTGYTALLFVIGIVAGLLLLGFIYTEYRLLPALPFVVLFALAVVPPFIQAAKHPEPAPIRKAVKRGVLSLIILNSVLASGFAGIPMGVFVVLLLPLSMGLGKVFAVT